MNFYPHHIGDYMTATAHLTWLEDAAYRRLLDLYYSREQSIPVDLAQAARLIRATSKDERKAVETVLREFFTETPTGWTHGRCEVEIQKAKEAAERARVNGKRGGRPAKAKPRNNPEITQPVSVANPEKSNSQAPITNPITNTSNSVAKATDADASPGLNPVDALFQIATPWLVDRGVADKNARSLLGAARKQLGDNGAWVLASECMREQPHEPASWLASALNARMKTGKQSRHNDFDKTDYSEGVIDGRIA